jgi:IS30 family transposase
VTSKHHNGGLLTLAERSHITCWGACSKHAEGVTAVATRLLKPHKTQCHTITFGNGKEFADHETLAAALETDIYFAHPYRSRERGLNESSNGLLRQYFSKEMALTETSREQAQ